MPKTKQTATARKTQLLRQFGMKLPKLTDEASVISVAEAIKDNWLKSPKHLESLNITNVLNEINGIIEIEHVYKKEAQVVRNLVKEIIANPPTELAKNEKFKSISKKLNTAIGEEPPPKETLFTS